VVAINPAYTSQDCSNCGHRAKKTLSTRTHSCPNCQIELCRDPNAALNILQKEMSILGVEWQSGKCGLGVSPSEATFQDNGTSGHEGSASENEGKTEEKTASTTKEQSEVASGLR
jgi:putative transposase